MPKNTSKIPGSKGYAELDYINQILTLCHQPTRAIPTHDFKAVQAYSQTKIESIKIKKQEPLKLELEDFLNKCQTYKQTKTYADLHPLNALKIVLGKL